MSAYLDRVRDLDVPVAVVGGTPIAAASRPAQEPPQIARSRSGVAVRPRAPEPTPAPRIADLAPGELVELYGR